MKDWSGNKKSIYATLGASSHSIHEREQHDYYATDPLAIDLLLNATQDTKDYPSCFIWENACGEGHLADRLIALNNNFVVRQSDIVKRHERMVVHDFLQEGLFLVDGDIITNPPYRYAQEWVERSLACLRSGQRLYLFLKLTFFEGKKRRSMFDRFPPKLVLVSSQRIMCAKNGDFNKSNKGSSAVCYAWFIWKRGCTDETKIRWL